MGKAALEGLATGPGSGLTEETEDGEVVLACAVASPFAALHPAIHRMTHWLLHNWTLAVI